MKKNQNPTNPTSLLKRWLVIILLAPAFITGKVKAANYYWVGGTGNWSDYANHWATTSGGVIFHTTIPSLNDDVFFDANSFAIPGNVVTVDSTFIYCHNMDWTGAQFNPLFEELSGLFPQFKIFGSLTLVQGMQFEVHDLTFLAAAGTQTITSHNVTVNADIRFTGTATFNLNDDFSTWSLRFDNGAFNSNNYAITTSSSIRFYNTAINLGTSLVTCGFQWEFLGVPASFVSSGASLIFTSYGSFASFAVLPLLQFDSITFLAPGSGMGGSCSFSCNYMMAAGSVTLSNAGPNQIQKAVFFDDVRIETNTVFDSLTLINPGHILNLMNGNPTITINQGIILNGTCGQPNSISGGALSKSSGTVTVNYAILTNTNATGGAAFIANNSVDAGGNTGWTINASAPHNVYWVGGSGNWSDPNHWALSSGGAGGSCVPSLNDDVFFDANSFSAQDTVILDVATAYCHNMDWTGAQFNPLFDKQTGPSVQLKIYGSLTLVQGMLFRVYNVSFLAAAGTQTITTHGVQMSSYIRFDGAATYNLNDDFSCGSLRFDSGAFNSNSHAIAAGTLTFYNVSINLGSSLITCGDIFFQAIPASFISNNVSIIFSSNGELSSFTPSPISLTFDSITFLGQGGMGGGYSFICNYLNGDGYVTLSNSGPNQIGKAVFFDDVRIETNTVFDSLTLINPGHILQLMYGNPTITINQGIIVNGTCGQPSSISGGALSKSSGTVTVNYAILTNTNATGGAAFIANNSVDAGGNTGWTINASAPHNVYWVGGSGNWSDPNHWALSSGGAGGSCVPSLNDEVFFDANSFSAQDTVILDVATAYCHNMDWTGAQFNPLFDKQTGPSVELKIYGSLTLVQGMLFRVYNVSFLAAAGTQTITTHGVHMSSYIRFDGAATYNLTDDFSGGNLRFGSGAFNSNNYAITTNSSIRFYNTAINLGSSLVTCGFQWQFLAVPASFISSGASLIFATYGDFASFAVLPPLQFDSITFLAPGSGMGGSFSFSCNYMMAAGSVTLSNTGPNQIQKAVFFDDVRIETNTVFDSLILINPGHILQLMYGNPTITINQELIANSQPGFPLQISGGTLSKSWGQVCIDNVIIQNNIATGGAQFFAGLNSVDLGGNSGWAFTQCMPNNPNVWPGDANYDLTANNFDVLNIGLANGYTGPVRSGASLTWVAQPATDWSAQFATGANLKHADCDGNGTVDNLDTLAVSLNYGLTHPYRLTDPGSNQSTIPALYLEAHPDTAMEGDTVEVDIFLGTQLIPVDSIYGLAFTIMLDPTIVDTSYMPFDYTGCWMGTPGVNLLTFEKKIFSQGRVDVALTRTDHLNQGGYGYLGKTGIVIVDNVGARLANTIPYVTLPLSISNVRALTASEFYLTISTNGDNVEIDTLGSTGTQMELLNETISVYPNPVHDVLTINSGKAHINSIEIYNSLGENVMNEKTVSTKIKLNTENFEQGIYLLKLNTSTGVVSRKFSVVKK